jgi:demethylmenaquinone methyltransferase/2-methoxy-6-polyprenyl-1,4-benzoquinol methylase
VRWPRCAASSNRAAACWCSNSRRSGSRWRPLYDFYSFQGAADGSAKLVANDADSYRYLAESIRMHPDQETLKTDDGTGRPRQGRVLQHGAGVVALHRGYKV